MSAVFLIATLAFGSGASHDPEPHERIDEATRIGAVVGGVVGVVALFGYCGLQLAHDGVPTTHAIGDAFDAALAGTIALLAIVALAEYATYAAIAGGLVGGAIGMGVGALVDAVSPPE